MIDDDDDDDDDDDGREGTRESGREGWMGGVVID